MTLKDWNALSDSKRLRIAKIIFNHMSEDFIRDIAKEFHHNLNWQGVDGTYQEGCWYKIIMKVCKKQRITALR